MIPRLAPLRIPLVTLLLALAACASRAPRPLTYLGVRLRARRPYECTACAEKIARLVNGQPGVVRVEALGFDDSTLVIYERGKQDVKSLQALLAKEGLDTALACGPTAVPLDVRVEAPTRAKTSPLKEADEFAPLRRGYVPPTQEVLPGPGE